MSQVFTLVSSRAYSEWVVSCCRGVTVARWL